MVFVLEVDVLITGFFGVPGVGKSTIATMFAQRELKRIKFQSTLPVRGATFEV